jgi:hypothetical protein
MTSSASQGEGGAFPPEREEPERLSSIDDQATRTEGQFLDDALDMQSRRAEAMSRSTPGVCTNCRELCLPMAVFCDEDCRADHELRLQRRQRMGRL